MTFGRSCSPRPVATIVTFRSSPISASITVPTTTVAWSDANSSTMLPTSVNSPMLRSGPAVTFTRIPRAPCRSTSSNSGLRIADSAASRARPSPDDRPVPIMAIPISDITVRTSAKSTLIIPGRMMRSAIPCTAPNSTSFAAANASSMLVRSPKTTSSFSFGIVINESTHSDNSRIPRSAISVRFSNLNGRVTTATVSMSISFAAWATIGAAPVPVPPPIPAVMNTISAPMSTSEIRSRSSSAA